MEVGELWAMGTQRKSETSQRAVVRPEVRERRTISNWCATGNFFLNFFITRGYVYRVFETEEENEKERDIGQLPPLCT